MTIFRNLLLASIVVECKSFLTKYVKGTTRKNFSSYCAGHGRLAKKQPASIEDLKNMYIIPIDEEHPKTVKLALRHCHDFGLYIDNNIVSRHTLEAFSVAKAFVNKYYDGSTANSKLVILDSGCGVGLSTISLAAMNPNIPVIGIDKSIVRLQKNKVFNTKDQHKELDQEDEEEENILNPVYIEDKNMLLIRGELVDFWWLIAEQSDWSILQHYILYPNPYPKTQHLSRRWHGHPIFPVLLALGGRLEVRSNWSVYCREFQQAVDAVTTSAVLPGLEKDPVCTLEQFETVTPLTNFERKYSAAGIPLYRLVVDLPVCSEVKRKALLLTWTL